MHKLSIQYIYEYFPHYPNSRILLEIHSKFNNTLIFYIRGYVTGTGTISHIVRCCHE